MPKAPRIVRALSRGSKDSARPAKAMILVALPLYAGMQSLDVVGPAQVFSSANALADREVYRVVFVAAKAGPVPTSAGIALTARGFASVKTGSVDTLIVPGGEEQGIRAALANKSFMAWLGRAATGSRRACSVCTGAFLLAATGMLRGRSVATHWNATAQLRGAFATLKVDDESIYVNDGKFWTSAGVTTGIDMSLALVEQDCGRDVAMAVARQLVVYMRRPGHQTQFSTTLAAQSSNDHRLADVATWVENNLTEGLGVEALAERAHMSPRNFHRHMQAALGVSPAKFVESLRLDAARRLLESHSFDVSQTAARTGFSGADHFIRAFERRFGVTPGMYRQMHGVAAAQ